VVGVDRVSGVSGIIASERVESEGRDGGVMAGGVLGGGMLDDSVSGISGLAGLERGEIRSHPPDLAVVRPHYVIF
jgi:hypothetical protein